MTTSDIYVLSGEMQAVEGLLNLSEGEITPEIDSKLNEIAVKEGGIIDDIVRYQKALDFDTTAIKKEIERLKGLLDERKTRQETLKKWLLKYMIDHDVQSIRGAVGEARVMKGRQVVTLIEEAFFDQTKLADKVREILPDYVKFELSISKTRCKELLEQGEDLWFAKITEGEKSLRLK